MIVRSLARTSSFSLRLGFFQHPLIQRAQHTSASLSLKRIFPWDNQVQSPDHSTPDRSRSEDPAGLWSSYQDFLTSPSPTDSIGELFHGLVQRNEVTPQQLISDLQEHKPPRSLESWRIIVDELIVSSLFHSEDIFAVVEKIEQSYSVNLILGLYEHLLNKFVHTKDYHSGVKTWKKILMMREESPDLVLSGVSYNLALKCHCKLHRTQEISDIIEDMIQNKIISSSRTYATCMTYLIEQGNKDAVVSLIHVFLQMPRLPLTSHIYTSMIQFAGSQKLLELVEMLLDSLYSRQIVPDATIYRAIIRAYLNCNDFRKATNILEEVKQQGLDGTTEWYAPFIRYLTLQGDAQSELLINQMEETARHLSVEITFLNSMISARCQLDGGKDMAGLRRILELMRSLSLEPSPVTHELVHKFQIQGLFQEYFPNTQKRSNKNRKRGPSKKMRAASSVLDLLS